MILHELRVQNFRAIQDLTWTFADRGVTLVVGENETGKSSMVEAFCLLLKQSYSSAHRERVLATWPVGSSDHPRVEATVTVNDEKITIEKSFGGSKTRAQAMVKFRSGSRQGEVLTGGEADDFVKSQVWESLDTLLWTVLTEIQFDSLAGLKLSESASLASALETACEGDRETDSVLELAREEYHRYVTEKQQMPTGDYRAAIAEQAAAADEVRLGQEDISRIEKAEEELDAALVLQQDLNQRLAEATHAASAAKEQADKAAAVRAELDEATQVVETATSIQKLSGAESRRR